MRLRKGFSGVEWKADDEGAFRATIATFNTVDTDLDVTFPGAFPVGKEIPISAYGHTSWEGALPVGRAAIGADAQSAFVEGRFFLDTTVGTETYRTMRNLGELGEWSYGYEVKQAARPGDEELQPWPGALRGLVSLEVFEASPVLVGAGVGTGTDYVKQLSLVDREALLRAAGVSIADQWKSIAAALERDGRGLSAERRKRIAADAAALRESAQAQLSVADELVALLAARDPEKARSESEALRSVHVRIATRLRERQGRAPAVTA